MLLSIITTSCSYCLLWLLVPCIHTQVINGSLQLCLIQPCTMIIQFFTEDLRYCVECFGSQMMKCWKKWTNATITSRVDKTPTKSPRELLKHNLMHGERRAGGGIYRYSAPRHKALTKFEYGSTALFCRSDQEKQNWTAYHVKAMLVSLIRHLQETWESHSA